jgi:hypothetical protein
MMTHWNGQPPLTITMLRACKEELEGKGYKSRTVDALKW